MALAGLLCVASSVAAMLLLRHTLASDRADRHRWTAIAGLATGVGIWATHFTAMLAYDPGVVLGYAFGLTVLSLALAVIGCTLAIYVAVRDGRRHFTLAAVVCGGSVALMHYVGMAAVTVPGVVRFAPAGVILSVALMLLAMVAAFRFVPVRRQQAGMSIACALFVIAILLLHFTGMAAITVIPDAAAAPRADLLSSPNLGSLIAFVGCAVLAAAGTVTFFAARTRSAIDARDREFVSLVQGLKDCAIHMLDPAGNVITWNSGAERLHGYSQAEALGLPFASFHSAQDGASDTFRAALRTAAAEGSCRTEGWLRRKDGSRFWAHVLMEAVQDSAGAFTGYATITRDMSRFRQDQESLAKLTANLDAALANMHQGLCLFDAQERLLLANDQVALLSQLPAGTIRAGMTFADLVTHAMHRQGGPEASPPAIATAIERHRASFSRPGGGTLLFQHGDDRTISCSHKPMPGGGFVTTLEDITDRRRAEQRIEHMALHDALTGLPNRNYFNERLENALVLAQRDGAQLAVFGIDLDRFKEVNDNHGHAAGDLVLRTLADRLRATLRDGEFCGRYGGDEFCAFKACADEADLADFIHRIEAVLTTEIRDGTFVVQPAGSVGLSVFPLDGDSREQLVNNADLAMYRSKTSPNQITCFYEQGMDECARARRHMASELHEAADRGQLRLVYQVQRSLRDDSITGYEALLRWHHPELGWVSPSDFIPVAEESGDIVRIGEWVLRTACMEAASWPEPWRVAINLSPVQLMHVDLPSLVTQALLESGLSAPRLELEITESAVIGDKLRALHVLRQIKAMGVTIAIDDFGTGYSSLDTLNSFPFDKIKIDRSFLLESSVSDRARAIIRAVLALGRSLDVPVLAEGLESAEQLELLRTEGCDEAQGYYFGRPGAIVMSGLRAAEMQG